MNSPAMGSVIRAFFDGLTKGEVDDALLTDEMCFWSVNSGTSDKARFKQGIALLAAVAQKSLQYHIDSLIVENDRAAAEVSSHGVLNNGDTLENCHVFTFEFVDGRIARVSEFMNQRVVDEKIMPLMMALAKQQG